MNLLDIYNMLEKGDLTLDQAAVAFGMTPRNLKFRITKWGLKLPLLLAILDKIKSDQITRTQAAEALNVSEREINKLSNNWKVTRPIKPYLVDKAQSEVKWDIRKKYAIDYIGDGSTIEEAAEGADVTTRQMRRWIANLLKKHYEMEFKDLARIAAHRRRRLAEEIRASEGLHYEREAAVRAVATGQATIQDLAIERVTARKRK